MTTPESELHLFILWQHARSKQQEIVSDIGTRFHIVEVLSITWSKSLFARNLSRFYGQKLPAHSTKERQCGNGAFLLVLVRDDNPRYEMRQTTVGEETVNTSMFDAKQRYREWTGGGHRIHGTNSTRETQHDLTLLLGAQFVADMNDRWDGTVKDRAVDLAGAHGWHSLRELLAVLNKTIPYVVLRNFEEFPDTIHLDGHSDIDILVQHRRDAALVANAQPVFHLPYRVQHTISITGENIPCDIRFVGDNYFDKAWQEAVLWSRTYNANGFYTPEPQQYFYTLLYHTLIHKEDFAEDYKIRLQRMADDLGMETAEMLSTREGAQRCLETYLTSQGYAYTDPSDLSVIYNPPPSANAQYSLARRLKNIRRAIVRPIAKMVTG